MAPKAKQGGALAKVHAACKALELEKVTNDSWAALREAECALSLDLQVDIEHVSCESLFALANSLEPIRTPELGAEFWQWLAQPTGSVNGGKGGIARIRALLVMLGQVCGNSSELLGAAGAAYLALLTAQGADQQWSVLFQPGIFRQILRALRGLRRGELKPRKEKKDSEGADDDAVMAEAEAEGGEEEAASGALPHKEALELLGRLSTFFLERGLGSSAEAGALVVEEIATLMLRPLDDVVARHASSALSALVARAGGVEDVRRVAAAAVRATLPAVLMTQERLNSFQGAIPRPLQLARNTALNFVCGLIRNHPELLNPQAPPAPAPAEDEGAEAPKKRGRRKGRRAAEDDQSEAEAEAEDEDVDDAKAVPEAEEVKDGEKAEADGPEGEKKGRRRRPRGNGVDDPIVALLELICILTPDRSEWRSLSADSVITLLCQAADVERRMEMMGRITTAVTRRTTKKTADPAWEGKTLEVEGEDDGDVALPLCEGSVAVEEGTLVAPLDSAPHSVPEWPTSSQRFMMFLERILESERVSWRILATEVAVTSLERSGQLARKGSEDARADLVKKLLLALTRRCSDAVPTVRSRALGGVATAMQYLAKCGKSLKLLQRIAVDQADPQYIDLPGMFSAAAADEKPIARRAALNLFDAVVVILREPLGLDAEGLAAFFDVNVLASLSADDSILVRKSCVSSLALLLRTCPRPRVCEIWVKNVLPLVLDVEQSVAERALDELEAAVLNPLAEAGGLPEVLGNLDSEAVEYLQRGLKQLSKRNEGKLPQRFVDSLVRVVQDCSKPRPLREWPLAVWSMLEEVTLNEPTGAISFDLVLDAWILFSTPQGGKNGGLGGLAAAAQRGPGSEGVLGTKILRVLENMVPAASQDRMQELMDSLCGALASFSAPTSMVRALMCAIERVEETWKAKKLYAQRSQERSAWRASFLKSIQAMLCEYVRPDAPEKDVDPRALCSALFTLGELALIETSIISDGIVMQVQTIATNCIWRDGQRVNTDPAARGQAFAALGKFCLKREPLAKKSVELLVLHLNTNESFVVRNNVLIVLGDLCIHYTALVDRFVSCMTGLLQDPNEILRKQAAMTLASLLSEDFIKLRGSIMLRLLYVLSDPSETVRNFVECVFARILHSRNTTMFSQSFLDVICSLNGWAGLPNFQGATGNEEFSLQRSPSRRAMIYRFMLTLMSNDQKFNVCAQIVTTLLAAFVDSEEKIELPQTIVEPAGQALSDGLALLCCKEMRICFTTQRAGQDEDGEAEGGGDKASAEAARGVLSSILKRNMCENIVPVLIQLKNLMEARHSPFLRQLRHCLREILRDFKDDLKDMLAGDAQLASEIAFDLQAQAEAPAKEVAEKPMLPHLGGASRRVSLGSMMKTPNAKAVNPIADLESTPLRGSVAGSVIPKARRSSLGSATRKSCGDDSATRKSVCGEEIQLDSSPRPLVRSSERARAFMSPTPQRSVAGSPQHVPSLPVTGSQDAGSAAAGQRAGKRRRGAQGAVA
mmetsp:Transcript_90837/g.265922  ORF Transcript_90837/g.265922 Transcript_90837/m.265922 type:complete len:1504 (+) Transcript_90837:65-4576(+)